MDNLIQDEDTSENELTEYGDLNVASLMAKNHFVKNMTKDSRFIKWGKLTDEIGYIQILTMWLFADLEIPQKLKDSIGLVDAYICLLYTSPSPRDRG